MTHSTISWETVTRRAPWACGPTTLCPATVIGVWTQLLGLCTARTSYSVTSTPGSDWTGRTPIGTISVTVTAAGSLARETTLSQNVQ